MLDDEWISLIGAVIRQAIADAKTGDSDAHHFLDHVFPEWEEAERKYDSTKYSSGAYNPSRYRQRNNTDDQRTDLQRG